MSFSLFHFLILILCNRDLILTESSLNDECLALLTFKQSIKQDPSGSLANWDVDSGDAPCSWNGVTCDQQKVVSLIIPNNKLSGSLSPSLGSLSELRTLNLSSNSFYGVLPLELFKAQALQTLALDGNFLSGLLPYEVGNLRYVQTLDLSRNLLSGSLPASLIQCKSLRVLDFSRNNFTGPLGDKIGGSLVLLETLNLSYNEFGGSIPGGLGKLSNLQGTLDLSHNMFSGSVPSDLGNLPGKLYIDLTYNYLSGPIPRNGSLVNRGAAAFIGNLGLCGPPLNKPCSSFPNLPNNSGSQSEKIDGGRGLSKGSVAVIVVCSLVGISVIVLLNLYCYLRILRGDKKGKIELCSERKSKIECSCFRKDESETLSEDAEQYDLVALDGQLGFNLDQLLKASAFMLGKSGIGILFKVVLENGQCLAVRRLGEGILQKCKKFHAEVESIGKLRHRNIVNLRAYYWSVDEKLLIYDFLPNGNLASAIHGKPGLAALDPLPWSTRLKIMKGVVRGLVYLHEYSPKKYVHGNLTPTNILLDHDADPQISDFGLVRLATLTGVGSGWFPSVRSDQTTVFEKQSSESVPTTLVPSASFSSSYYLPPESLKVTKPSQKWDVYSYGVILLEMITGRVPLVQVEPGSVMELVQWMQASVGDRRPLSDMVDPHLVREEERVDEEIIEVLKIVMGCVQSEPERRAAMGHVLERMERVGLSYD